MPVVDFNLHSVWLHVEKAQRMARHESAKTTKLYDRGGD